MFGMQKCEGPGLGRVHKDPGIEKGMYTQNS